MIEIQYRQSSTLQVLLLLVQEIITQQGMWCNNLKYEYDNNNKYYKNNKAAAY